MLGHWCKRGPGPPRSQDSAWGGPVTFGLRPGPGLGGQRVCVHAPSRQCVLCCGPGHPPPLESNLELCSKPLPVCKWRQWCWTWTESKSFLSVCSVSGPHPPPPRLCHGTTCFPLCPGCPHPAQQRGGTVARQGGTCAGLVARDPVWMSLRPPDSLSPAPGAAALLSPCMRDIPAGIPWCSVAALDTALGCQASSPLPSVSTLTKSPARTPARRSGSSLQSALRCTALSGFALPGERVPASSWFQAHRCPPSRVASGDAGLSGHLGRVYKFSAPFPAAAWGLPLASRPVPVSPATVYRPVSLCVVGGRQHSVDCTGKVTPAVDFRHRTRHEGLCRSCCPRHHHPLPGPFFFPCPVVQVFPNSIQYANQLF